MSNFGIVSHEESGSIVVSFSKPQFQDFMASLTSSPREEVFRILSGYNLNKAALRNLLDRLKHQVSTQNNLISDKYTFTCTLENKHEITWQSFEQFFGTSEVFKERVQSLSVSITFMIAFNRNGEQKIERQVVSIEFNNYGYGVVKVRIMSTEITWPPTIFQLIDREVSALSTMSMKDIDSERSPLRQIIKGMLGDRMNASLIQMLGEYSSESRILSGLKGKTLAAITVFQLLLVLFAMRSSRDRPILNPETNMFERGTFDSYVDSMGLDWTIAHAEKSIVMYAFDYGDWAEGHGPLDLVSSMFYNFVTLWGAVIGLAIALVVVYCRRKTEKYYVEFEGRIFLTDSEIPARKPVKIATGLFEAVLTGLFATAVWMATTQFFRLLS